MTSSLSEEQIELKDQGNLSLKGGDAARALELFSQAIDLSGGNSKDRAILFSNRAACQMTIGNYQDALDDAESCIRLNSDFPKGWSRKGHALFCLARYKESRECFEVAATKATNPTDAKSYRDWAEKAQPIAQQQQQPSSRHVSGLLPISVVILRVLSISMVFYWLLSGDPMGYSLSMQIHFAATMYQVLVECGKPAFKVEYLERIVRSQVRPSFYLLMVMATFSPNLPSVLCAQAYDLIPVLSSLNARLPTQFASLQQRVYDSAWLETLNAASSSGWRGMSTKERFQRLDGLFEEQATRFQLGVMFVLLFQLFTPARSVIAILVYSQVLKLRYLSHDQTRVQIQLMDQAVTTFASRYRVLQVVYAQVRRGLVAVFGPRNR